MRLSCQKAFLVLLVSTIGCHDTTAPATVSAQFNLQNIDGRQLPTPFAFTPGLTKTVLSATLTLDKAGKATMSENDGNYDGTETTFTTTFDYRLNGNDIEIGCFDLTPGLCAGHFMGTLTGVTLSLVVARSVDYSVTYNYLIASNF